MPFQLLIKNNKIKNINKAFNNNNNNKFFNNNNNKFFNKIKIWIINNNYYQKKVNINKIK